jgi:hypothetical protein
LDLVRVRVRVGVGVGGRARVRVGASVRGLLGLGEQREPPPLLLLQCLQVVKVPLPEEACPRR